MDNGKVFIEELLKIKSSINKDSEFIFDEDSFRRAFLYVGSETEENLEAIKNIEYGKYSEDSVEGTAYALKVKNKNISICDVFFWAIEANDNVVLEISNKYPELTKTEVESILRFITIILCSLEQKIDRTDNDF